MAVEYFFSAVFLIVYCGILLSKKIRRKIKNVNIIGFTMYGEILSEQRVWMDRFLIDQKYQGQGHGKKALSDLIQYLFDRYSCKEIYLSLYPDNQRAFALYCNLGFELNGELDTKGEQIMVLKERTWEINQNNQNMK